MPTPINPGISLILSCLLYTSKKSGSWFSYQGNNIGQGRDAVKELLDDNPELADEVAQQVMDQLCLLYTSQHYAEAATDYAQALKITPDDFYLSFNLAGSLYGAEQYERCLLYTSLRRLVPSQFAKLRILLYICGSKTPIGVCAA